MPLGSSKWRAHGRRYDLSRIAGDHPAPHGGGGGVGGVQDDEPQPFEEYFVAQARPPWVSQTMSSWSWVPSPLYCDAKRRDLKPIFVAKSLLTSDRGGRRA